MDRPAPDDARFTIEQYYGLVEQGLLGPDDRVELLEGVVVGMAPQNPPHAAATQYTAQVLQAALGTAGMVRVQLPLHLGQSVPEPDVAVVPPRADRYAGAHPTTALLVVEVAQSSLAQDRITKARIYAAAGVGEYWLVNLRDDVVEVLREPDPSQRCYRDLRLARRDERLGLLAFPGVSVAVDDVLPPRPST
jgi:Uma2 family endonuclease